MHQAVETCEDLGCEKQVIMGGVRLVGGEDSDEVVSDQRELTNGGNTVTLLGTLQGTGHKHALTGCPDIGEM